MIRLIWIIVIMYLLEGCALIKGMDKIIVSGRSPKLQKEVFSGYDNSTFVADVTISDGMEILPATRFEKIWRLRNTGTTTWKDYSIVFIHGDVMDAPSEAAVPDTPSGGEVNIVITMQSPEIIGSYIGFWRLKNDRGILFGDTLWVNIKAKD